MTPSPIAHDRAVAAVIDQLSTEACFARRGHGGAELVEANGFIGAAFRHRTSRAGDPQLHTHVVVPNLVQAADGRWSAPDGRHLFAWKMTAGALYRSALRAELAPLGLAWDIRRNGLSELRGRPEDDPQGLLEAPGRHRGSDGRPGDGLPEGGRNRRARHAAREASTVAPRSTSCARDGWSNL